MWLYLALAIIALVYYMVTCFKCDYWEKKGLPTASGNELFFGHFRPIVLLKKHYTELYQAIYREFPDAPLVGYYAMSAPMLMVKDLDIIKTILVSEFSNFSFTGMKYDKKADPLAAAHPFFLQGDEWKSARAQVIPSLTLSRLKGYLPNILKVGDVMVQHVKKNCVGATELETRDLARAYSTDVIGTVVYGIENNTFENKDSLVSHLTREIKFETNVTANIVQCFQGLPILNWFFPSRLISPRLQDVLVAMTRKIIKERLTTGEKRNDLIQMLLAQKENDTQKVFTDEYMAAQVFIFIIDLYESGNNAISMLLCLYPGYGNSFSSDLWVGTFSRNYVQVQERLRSEINEIISRNKGEFTIEDIEGAKYLDMVYNETFRLVSFDLTRECTSDCYIPRPGSEPLKITKGSTVLIPVTSIQKDPKYYPDPEKFDPERFSEEEVAKRPKFTYMPFGEGPKKCIGVRVVSLHIKVAIIKILKNFKLLPSPKTKYPFDIDPHYFLSVRSKGGSWVIFEPICK